MTGVILEVDVISEGLLLTSSQVRPFAEKSFVPPVFVESHFLRYAHNVNNGALLSIFAATGTDNPITYCRRSSNYWLARGKSAYTKERIWRKTIIMGNNVGE